MFDVWGKSLPEMEAFVADGNFPRFRARQILDYVYRRNVFDFSKMLQLPQNMRQWLSENAVIYIPEVADTIRSSSEDTMKLLLRLRDGSLVETVCMGHDYGNSICVSTQVGCGMGCIFCASTRDGVKRNLTASEMLSQVYLFKIMKGIPVHSIVLMGSGEPLTNYEECLRFIKLCHDPFCLGLSYRNITLSTCGIVPNIYRLADENIPITLAISLHAPNDSIRNRLMPSSRKYKIHDVVRAAEYYFTTTGRRVTFEYILIKGMNAGKENALELCSLLQNNHGHINLIPVNGTEHSNLYPPSGNEIYAFKRILESKGRAVTLRKKMGDKIEAACGQLKRRYTDAIQESAPQA